MSKYNHMESIAFSEIPENEIGQAIKEWSQGNKHMERLLWGCRINRVETMGCHPLGRPYLDMTVNNSHNKIRNMLNVAQTIPNSIVLLTPDGGNPLSGEKTWYLPGIAVRFDTTKRREINKIFDKLYDAVTFDRIPEKPQTELFAQMLDFYDFFAGKESGLTLYMGRNKKGVYKFNIINKGTERNFEYYNSLFRKAGMQLNEDKDEWTIASENESEIDERVRKAKTVITGEYSLGIPSEVNTDMNLNMIARITKRRFGETAEGQQRFRNWLGNLERRMSLYLAKKIGYEELIGEAMNSKNPNKNDNDDFDK